jgi:ribosomal protein S18 acetylase RimI-like enzyme
VVVKVEEVYEDFDGLLSAIRKLVRELSDSAPELREADLRHIVHSPASRLLIARDNGEIIGMLTLVLFRIPTGIRAWIEDVVVDPRVRGQGVGQALTEAALRIASESGARTADLTSRPGREAANRLYKRIGFTPRETTVYRFDTSLLDE